MIEFVIDAVRATEVMRNAASWLVQANKHPSEWWQVDRLTPEALAGFARPDEFHVGLIDGTPAVAAILQDGRNSHEWHPLDGANEVAALYVHWFAVAREFAGTNLSEAMVDHAADWPAATVLTDFVSIPMRRATNWLRFTADSDSELGRDARSGRRAGSLRTSLS